MDVLTVLTTTHRPRTFASAVAMYACIVSCGSNPVRITAEMYDGWTVVDNRVVDKPQTTIVISLFDEGQRRIIDDETRITYTFALPDTGVRTLPVSLDNFSGTRVVECFCPTQTREFHGTTFRVIEAVPGGFRAVYDLDVDADRISGEVFLASVGKRRLGAWPYDPRERPRDKPTLPQRVIQLARDAINGAI